jgi:hypothetical protein
MRRYATGIRRDRLVKQNGVVRLHVGRDIVTVRMEFDVPPVTKVVERVIAVWFGLCEVKVRDRTKFRGRREVDRSEDRGATWGERVGIVDLSWEGLGTERCQDFLSNGLTGG